MTKFQKYDRFKEDNIMLNENAKKWVNALRSGKYKQGKHALRNLNDEYCCLGVACDLAVKEGVIPKEEKTSCVFVYGGSTGLLPVSVKNWLNLTNDAGMFDEGVLIVLNDDDGLSFNQIADIIESEPKGLFNE